MTSAKRTDPALWEQIKKKVMKGSKDGKAGQWSARKAQLAVKLEDVSKVVEARI